MSQEVADLHLRPIGDSLWRAGAGAGKTFNLVKRVMRIAEDWSKSHRGEFPRLVVTTFTRMATQELRVRLMEEALRAAANGDTELIPFVTSRSQLFVTTLHGVMDSFLRSFGSEIGLEPGFRLAGPEELETLVRRIGKRILFPDAKDTATNELSQAVEVLLSEFDFSTTLRLLQRVARVRVEFETSEVPARPATAVDMRASMAININDLTLPLFELREEIRLASDDAKWAPFTEWLGKIISQTKAANAADLKIDHLVELLDEQPKITNSGKHKIDFGAGLKKWKDPVTSTEKIVENLNAELTALEKFETVNGALAKVEVKFSQALRTEKFRSGLIELEDLELLALELVRKSPTSAKTYAEGWDHWLIDEYQDTSPRQVLLITALAEGRPQFVVGDPQQSIYLFRGARPNVFLDREEVAQRESHEKIELLENRRSHPDVMNFVNYGVKNLGADFQTMTSVRAEQADLGRRATSVASPFGAVTWLTIEPATDSDGKGGEQRLKIDELRRIEAEQISNAVEKILLRGASPASIAILSRSNKDLIIIAREFGRRGLPFQVHTAGAYSDRLEVADLCALLGFLSNPHDDQNLIHLARTVWFPISEDILVKGYRRKTSLWKILEQQALSHSDQHEIETLQAGLVAAKERGLVQAFREMLMTCDFFSWCGVLDPSGRREANALKFISKLAVAERQAGFVPRRFSDEILGGGDRGGESESNDRDAVAAAKPDRVHLMTIHVSKGLEFDHVFLPFLADAGKSGGGFGKNEFIFHEQKRVWTVGLSLDDEGGSSAGPLSREWNSIVDGWGIEEKKRLLYVAMTRARESLFLSSTGEPKKNSFLDFLKLSREVGSHQTYETISHVDRDDSVAHSVSKFAGARVPWGSIERKRSEKVFASISVSRLLEMEDELLPAESSERPMAPAKRSLEMAIAAARGTRLHRVFEMAKPDSARTEAENADLMAREIARWFTRDENIDEQSEAISALRWLLALKEPELSTVLMTGEVEWSFTYVRGDYAVDGQIDLWGRDGLGKLWVVDYKTGDSRYKDKALRQLKYYAEALRSSGFAKSGEEVYLCALYPFSEEVFTKPLVLN